MTTLGNLEKLAGDAIQTDCQYDLGLFQISANPETIKQMCVLMRQMQGALITARNELWNAGCNDSAGKVLSAIAAFDEFNGKPETANALRKVKEGMR